MKDIVLKYYYTIIYLRPIQIRYQLWYRLSKYFHKFIKNENLFYDEINASPLSFAPWINKPISFTPEEFAFLNKSMRHDCNFNWRKLNFGKLWDYNLNYMDFLLQRNMKLEYGKNLIEKFIYHLPKNLIGQEPYPTALRGINWIKFFAKFNISDSNFNGSLYAQYKILSDNLEYHLLGNHLLENGFSLLFGAFHFRDNKLYCKSKKILIKELNEQILGDGAHFELSPMYHQIILDRLLDCINLMMHNKRFEDQNTLESLLKQKAEDMLVWLNTITFANGEIPLLNDSATEIAPTTRELNLYAQRLKIDLSKSHRNPCEVGVLKDSGYRKYKSAKFECIVDIGQIGPSYQSGHAHADTFNFVVNSSSGSFIVDTGISTYEPNSTRLSERGTGAHNTVTVVDKNSSEVWSSFRVAHRAMVKIIEDREDQISATHDGYKKLGVIHKRDWKFSEDTIHLEDTLYGKVTCGISHLHFAPGLIIEQNGHSLTIGNSVIEFTNSADIKVIQAKIPDGYNRFVNHYKAEITFDKHLITLIQFKLH